jgi:hypothetical protein
MVKTGASFIKDAVPRRLCKANWLRVLEMGDYDMPLLAASLRNMLWNMPASYAIGSAVLIITIVGLWATSRW